MTRLILALAVLLALTGTARAGGPEYCKQGLSAHRASKLDLAIEYYTRCIDYGDVTQKHLARAFNNRGFAYYEKGEYDRAIADYDRAIQLTPDYAYAFSNRGNVYDHKGEYDRAIADYDQVIRLKPDHALSFYNRGIAYRLKGEYEQAIRDYDRAIELKPDYANAFVNRGIAYRLKGEYNRAIRDYDQAIRLNPDSANAFNSRGNAYDDKGEYDRAIADYDQAIRLNPDYAIAYDNKASALNGKAWELATSRSAYKRDGLEAVRVANEAVRINDKPSHRDTLAAAFAEAGRFDDAVAEQERVIEMAQAVGMHDQIADLQSRLDLYRQHRPYRE